MYLVSFHYKEVLTVFIQGVLGGCFVRHKANHSPLYSANFKRALSFTSVAP
jgi:hypothetical protein